MIRAGCKVEYVSSGRQDGEPCKCVASKSDAPAGKFVCSQFACRRRRAFIKIPL